MKARKYKSLLYFSLCLSLPAALGLVACAAAGDRDRGSALAADLPVANERAASVSGASQQQGAGLYDIEPEPLTFADCARCHTRHFEQLRDDGGGHRIDCRQCHEIFHAYNPRRDNFDELMPKCADCHGLPHGETQIACLSCHEHAHAPKQIPFSDLLVSACADCHQSPAGQLQAYPSKHAAVGCQSCHPQNHGRILSCLECHGPHFDSQPLAECTQCHGAHKPLELAFPPKATATTCNACHGEVFRQWAGTTSKHGGVSCSECHTSHLLVPSCTECHPQPHNEGMLAKFSGCLDCHLDVHDLPVR